MANENALLSKEQEWDDDNFEWDDEKFDLDELEGMLELQLEEELCELDFLEEEKEKIGNPDALGKMIEEVIMEQIRNQIGVTAGEKFIEENGGMTLDLRDEVHIQTTKNFEKGNIATHNTKIDYQERYDNYQRNFAKDSEGKVIYHTTRGGKKEETILKGARKPFDEGRTKGSTAKNTDMDHTISAAEIMRDPAANAHISKEEQIKFANSDKNLNEMDSSLNRSKGDKSMQEWLDKPNSKGQKPDEIFDISAEDEAKLRKKDKEAREEYEKRKEEGEKKSVETGKQSQKEEAFRIGGEALKAAISQLLLEMVKEVIDKLVKWFKSANKNLKTLGQSITNAVKSFVAKMKTHLTNAGNTAFSAITTAIVGPIFKVIKKIWMFIKQGIKSFRDIIAYMKNPDNKNKSISIKMMEIGKIAVAGLTIAGALVLGEAFELVLNPYVGAIQIPLLGSVANILGIFLGAIVSGIAGAIVMNFINKSIAKKLKEEADKNILAKGNQILSTQKKLQIVNEVQFAKEKADVQGSIIERHKEANAIMQDAYDYIMEDVIYEFSDTEGALIMDMEEAEINIEINKISDELDSLLSKL